MSNQLFAVSDGGGGVGTLSAPGFGAAAAASAGGGAGAGAAWLEVVESCSGAGLLCLAAFVVCGARASAGGTADTIRDRARNAPKYQCCEYFIVDSVTAVVAVDCSVVDIQSSMATRGSPSPR